MLYQNVPKPVRKQRQEEVVSVEGSQKNTIVENVLKMYFSTEFSITDIIEATGLSKTTLYKYVREYKNKNDEKNMKNGKLE